MRPEKKDRYIFGSYNHEKIKSHLDRAREKGRFEKYFSGGVEFFNTNVLSENKREQIIVAGNHISHFDYLLAATAFLDNLPDGRFPHIVAGNSLDVPFLPCILRFNYRDANVCWLDREKSIKNKEYLEGWARAVRTRLSNGESFMYYPEGTRVFNKNRGIVNVKGSLFFNMILDARVDPLVVTFTVDYDHPIEEPCYDLISWGRKNNRESVERGIKGLPKKALITSENYLKRATYYGADALAFLKRPYARNSGKAYLRVGEPKRLTEIIEESSEKRDFLAIRNFIFESINRDYELIQREKS